nr:hypothetical protein [Shuttleworthia satelles]
MAMTDQVIIFLSDRFPQPILLAAVKLGNGRICRFNKAITKAIIGRKQLNLAQIPFGWEKRLYRIKLYPSSPGTSVMNFFNDDRVKNRKHGYFPVFSYTMINIYISEAIECCEQEQETNDNQNTYSAFFHHFTAHLSHSITTQKVPRLKK